MEVMQGSAKTFFSLRSRIPARLSGQHGFRLCIMLGLALSIVACTSQETRPELNSERIRQSFGSYGVDVLANDENRRVSSLYSSVGSDKTTRTYAVVDFIEATKSNLGTEHALIEAGGSIGEVFRDAGWSIDKRHLFIGEFFVPVTYTEIGALMRVNLPEHLAADVYLFVVSKNDRSYNYATITEIHHPDYLSGADLKRIYGEILFDNSNRNSIGDFIGPARD
jgi:hypothetical protein